MKARVIASFLVFSLVTVLGNTVLSENFNEKGQDKIFAQYVGKLQEIQDEKFDSLGITLHPGTDYNPQSNVNPISLNHCKSLVYRTLKSLPEEPVNHLKNLTLYFSDTGRRGLGGGDTIILRCQNVTDEELAAVLVHEMGHIMDTGVMQGSSVPAKKLAKLVGVASESENRNVFMDGDIQVAADDPSLEFYRISFKDSNTLKDDVSSLDFVSGYAMSDPFEDFAESYAYYLLHGNEFRYLAKNNKKLLQKYNFLKEKVFKNVEYFNGIENAEKSMNLSQRNYDVTILSYSIEKFLKI